MTGTSRESRGLPELKRISRGVVAIWVRRRNARERRTLTITIKFVSYDYMARCLLDTNACTMYMTHRIFKEYMVVNVPRVINVITELNLTVSRKDYSGIVFIMVS